MFVGGIVGGACTVGVGTTTTSRACTRLGAKVRAGGERPGPPRARPPFLPPAPTATSYTVDGKSLLLALETRFPRLPRLFAVKPDPIVGTDGAADGAVDADACAEPAVAIAHCATVDPNNDTGAVASAGVDAEVEAGNDAEVEAGDEASAGPGAGPVDDTNTNPAVTEVVFSWIATLSVWVPDSLPGSAADLPPPLPLFEHPKVPPPRRSAFVRGPRGVMH